MLKTLPSLPSTWEHWDWYNSNGEATVQQTMNASNACLHQGLCSEFSRYVWNDLVNYVANTLSEVGLEWDDIYGDVESCKISEYLGSLTAAAFNGVARNIHNFRFIKWKWSRESDLPGYVGRDEFRGYSDYQKESDHVYGWYIFELTVKLNKVIEVLKNEADFSEFERLLKASSKVSTEALGSKAVPAKYASQSSTKESTILSRARTLETSGVIEGYSYQKGILVPVYPKLAVTDEKVAAYTNAVGDGLRIRPTSYLDFTISHVNAAMKDLLYVGYMNAKEHAKAPYIVELSVLNILETVTYMQACSNLLGELVRCLPILFKTAVKIDSASKVDAVYIESLPLVVTHHAEAFSAAVPIILNPVATESTNNILNSYQRSVLSRIYPMYIKGCWIASSYSHAKSEVFVALPMYYTNYTQVIVGADAISFPTIILESAIPCKAPLEALVITVRPAYSDSSLCCNSENNATIKICDVVKIIAQEKSVSMEEASLIVGKPKFSQSSEKEQSYGKSTLIQRGSKYFQTKALSNTMNETTLSIGSPQEASSLHTAETMFVCEMDLQYAVHENWYDPVKSENNLYIRSAHPQWQEGNNVRLDSGGIFYDAEQTDGTVYIRSNDSMKEVI